MRLLSFSKYFVFVTSFLTMTASAQKCDYEAMLNNNMPKLEGYKFIKSFPVETDKQAETAEYNYLLNHDTKYRLVIVDNGNEGERMLVTIRGRDKKVLATNKDRQKKTFSTVVDFVCPATGIYFFEVSFQDGRRDCGLNILAFQK